MAKRSVGDVFYSGDLASNPWGTPSYWKITGDPIPGWLSHLDAYPVVKCSKLGKEYKQSGGFAVRAVDLIPEEKIFKGAIGLKANITNGNKIGALKRRHDFLVERIRRDSIELDNISEKYKQLKKED